MSEDRDEIAEELRRVRDEARRGARRVGDAGSESPAPVVPPDRPPPARSAREAEAATESPPPLPDAAPVNTAWRAEGAPPRGPSGLLRRVLERLLRARFEAQQAFNSHQVQLDNELLRYVSERADAVHLHHDRVLGAVERRLDDVDERHAMLEKELVGHVQDLVRRIDLVLADSSRGRAALEFALEEVREGLARVEKKLRRPE